MTDPEPRRSGRSTKGRHTRNSDVFEPAASPPPPKTPAPTRKRGAKAKEPTPTPTTPTPANDGSVTGNDDTEEEDQIRCPCGVNSEENGSRHMVQCDGCNVWQHNQCLGIPNARLNKNKAEPYFCEICKPELHKEFLERVERGEKPWEKKPKAAKRKSLGVGRGRGRKKDAALSEVTESHAGDDDHGDEEGLEKAAVDDEKTTPPTDGGEDEATAITPLTDDKVHDQPDEPTTPVDDANRPMEVDIGKKDDDQAMQLDSITPAARESKEEEEPEVAKSNVEDTHMGINGYATDHAAETVEEKDPVAPPASMEPASILDTPQGAHSKVGSTEKEDQEMMDVVEKDTPVTPTPTAISARESRSRKQSVPETTRTIKRKATHDSDGDYKSDSEKTHDSKHRRVSTSKLPPREVTKATPRKQSIAKPSPKKGPDDFSVQDEIVIRRDELRCHARQTIVTLLQSATQQITKNRENRNILNEEQKKDTYPETLAIAIEHHLYIDLWNRPCEPPNDYKNKARTIYSNVKSNLALQTGLLKGEITPARLAQMTSDEMAKKEMQILAEQVRRESEAHHTILSEDTGPRIRRTHKGEEIVGEDDNQTHGDDMLLYSSNAVDPADDEPQQGPEHSMSPNAHAFSEEPLQHSPRTSQPPQTPQTPTAKSSQYRGRQFSIQDVWSNVENPDAEKLPRLSVATHLAQQLPIRQGPHNHHAQPVNDPDIDKLLAEDHDMDAESPPYSPSDEVFNHDPATWGGRLTMVGKAEFPARATHIGGFDLSGIIKLSDLLQSNVLIDGRIPIDRATEYLCGQRFSNTNEVIVLSVEPDAPHCMSEFDKLFDYFRVKERYGVIGAKSRPHPSIKDCYVIPIDKEDELPDFFANMKKHSIPLDKPRQKRILCIVFVVTKLGLPIPFDHPAHPNYGKQLNPSTTQQPVPLQHPLNNTNLQTPLLNRTQNPHTPLAQPTYSVYPTPLHNPIAHSHAHPPSTNPLAIPASQETPAPAPKRFEFKPFESLEELLPTLSQRQIDGLNMLVRLNPQAAVDPQVMLELIAQHPGMGL